MALTVHHANVLDWARDYTGPKFHALLCDPPYELGFMGKAWDKSGVPFRADTWAALAAHLHPGAFLMAFASSRGWHRQAVAMEDAGLVIHPTLFGWAFGSGFPKATRVADAPAFNGHRYGLQALKPALEPVIVAQVPYQGRPVDCITRTGAGALWVDGGRIGTDVVVSLKGLGQNWRMNDDGWSGVGARPEPEANIGRWPANFYLADDAAAARLDEMSGTRPGVIGMTKHASGTNGVYGDFARTEQSFTQDGIKDTGGASRFFFRVAEQLDDADPVYYCAKASRRERDAGLDGMALLQGGTMDGGHVVSDGRTAAKTGRVMTRNPHPTLKPLSLTRYLATLLLPPAEYGPRRLLVPFAGVGSECVGAMMAGWDEIEGVELMNDEQHPYIDIARKRFDYWQAKHQPALLEVQP